MTDSTINTTQLLNRFGDIEFLEKLWLKAQIELPLQIEHLSQMIRDPEETNNEILNERLHKLRGLMANFLTEKHATNLLAECERLIYPGQKRELVETWEKFIIALEEESKNLDRWVQNKKSSS